MKINIDTETITEEEIDGLNNLLQKTKKTIKKRNKEFEEMTKGLVGTKK